MDNDNNQTKEPTEESFEELLNQSFVKPNRLKPGQKVESVIVKITDEWIFIDLGGKTEGYLSTREFVDEQGNLTVNTGDRIEAFFLSSENNEQLFTTRVGGSGAPNTHLEEAFHANIPVEGYVGKEIKGGFEVTIGGSVRAFCPFSQMGLGRQANPEEYVGKRLNFKIIEYGNQGRNIIVSNRALVEQERQAQKEALRESLQEGMTVKGTVTAIRDFGAFADIGGAEGLIPMSEIGWGTIGTIHDVLQVDQEVEVVVIKLDWEQDRISLSLKQAQPDPWDSVQGTFPEGTLHTGTVARLQNFGAFVTLSPGIDGLLHVSKLRAGKKVNHPRDVLAEGETVEVRVDSVDTEKKRISLSLAAAVQDRQQQQDDYHKYVKKEKKASSQSLGTLGDILKAKLDEKKKSKK